ncbi:two pore domain potassium channel family protein [Candidatus Berkelbacteria bacterium]|nr:two pore domain potassium channel family protein [Candidatus Berkelbacteria bacterium]
MSRRLQRALLIILLLLVTGTIVFHELENWSWVDSFYFTGVSILTIGYGDLTPSHDLSKIATVILGFAAVGVGFYALTTIGHELHKRLPDWSRH